MKIFSFRHEKACILWVPFVLLLFISSMQASASTVSSNADPEVVDPMELDIDANLNYPSIPEKYSAPVKRSSSRLMEEFKKIGFRSGLIRNGEVVMLTLKCSEVFKANTSEFTAHGQNIMSKLAGVAKTPNLYKIIIAVHADDTADAVYSYTLTEARANAIDDLITTVTQIQTNSIPYGMGFDQPIKDNHSMANRDENRRIEIYLVPEKGWIKK